MNKTKRQKPIKWVRRYVPTCPYHGNELKPEWSYVEHEMIWICPCGGCHRTWRAQA